MANTPSWVPEFASARRRALVDRMGPDAAQRAMRARCADAFLDLQPQGGSAPLLVDYLELFACHRWIEDGESDSAWRRMQAIGQPDQFHRILRDVAVAQAFVLAPPWQLTRRQKQERFLRTVAQLLRTEFGAVEIGLFAAIVRAALGKKMDRRRLRHFASEATPSTVPGPYDPDDV